MNREQRETATVNTSVRFTPSMYAQLRHEAERQDRSVNNLITHYVRRGLAQDQEQGGSDRS